ncbi:MULTISPECIES: GNAT family N-acetyltransferase [Bacillus]|uniref:GNAT family N-acetyltransferase n=1 Tax=Bacillus TaxID=1386 RepID=UPI00098A95ED|nr:MULTISPECIES: GNAT family N-acetyltransferase [Bacillus]WFA04592.1 GNAT family N-acetyltransferase [Bacillus sp. HSf4]
MEFDIRKMEMEDIASVQQVAKTSWNDTYDGIIPRSVQEEFLQSAYSDERMLERMERSLILVAEAGGEIVGFVNCSFVKEGGEAYLAAIYSYPEYQGNGIGSALLKEGIKRLEGVNKIFVEVEKDNRTGKHFYKAKGFEEISEYEEDFAGHSLKTVKMVLDV